MLKSLKLRSFSFIWNRDFETIDDKNGAQSKLKILDRDSIEESLGYHS